MTPLDRARRYMVGVESGSVVSCKWVKEAVARQRADLNKTWEYDFDEDRANAVCGFIESLPHIKGRWARERRLLTLEDWQCFILTTVFGWVDAKGLRRFRQAYIEVSRKNGKSALSSGVGLYCLTADGEGGPEVYSAATTRDQARIVWLDAKRMVERTPALREAFDLTAGAHAIFSESDAATFKALSSDAGNLDGLNIHCAIVDELHAHKTREVVEVIETATGSRDQPIVWEITTAGSNRAGVCYEHRDYSLKILKGVQDDPSWFGIIYTVDDGDDWTEPATWAKANPNLGVSVSRDDLARKCKKAMAQASAQPGFLTKHLNIWVSADSAWLDMRAWDRCKSEGLTLEDFEGQPCIITVDAASKLDLTVKLYSFYRDHTLYLFGKYWLPEETIENSPNGDVYRGWEYGGHLEATPGNIVDLDAVEDSIREDSTRFQVEEIAYDPFQMTQMAARLLGDGFPMIEYGATVRNFSEPMKALEADILTTKVMHNGDPVLAWCFSNVVCHTDVKENIYPRKEHAGNKIDAAVAAIMAKARWMVAVGGDSVYESRGLTVL